MRTEGQRRFLSAPVKRADPWRPEDGNAADQFDEAGLPHEREVCARPAGLQLSDSVPR